MISGSEHRQKNNATQGVAPKLNVRKIGIVSRDYRYKFPNGRRDFSSVLRDVLKILEGKGCDAVVFSLFSMIPQKSANLRKTLANLKLKRIKAVFLEEFWDFPKRNSQAKQRESERYVVCYCSKGKWHEYKFQQSFGSLKGKSRAFVSAFVSDELPKRNLGNCCVLLCGETNGVIAKKHKYVEDTYGLRKAIPQKASIILNPIHDRMTRSEMKKKREYFSTKGRWVISVWNKGKEVEKGRNKGKTRDGSGPAWTIFHNGIEKTIERLPKECGVERLPKECGVEIGIVETETA